MEIKTTEQIFTRCITKTLLSAELNNVKWVRVDSKLKENINSMLLIISSFTNKNTEGEKLLNEWKEYFKELKQ